MLFNFYNNPQPLWVWADKTSISPIKLNLHVDIRGGRKARIKGKRCIVSKERENLAQKGKKNIKLLGRGPRIRATQAVLKRKSFWTH